MHNVLYIICILIFALCISSCSVPSLEKPQCTASRDTVKRFYSFHFGSDMSSTPENIKAREQFLTASLITSLLASPQTGKDYFTATENYPKAFRVGECVVNSDEKASHQVLLLWRDDTKSEQKEVQVETLQINGKWLINRVSNR